MISPLPSEEGVSEMVIVVGVTSSSTTRGRIGGGGAEINMYKHRLIQLLCHKQCITLERQITLGVQLYK